MRESDYRAKTSLLHIHHTEQSLTEHSGSSWQWHSLDTQERQWSRIEYMLTVHWPSASFAPGGSSHLTTERQCRELLGHAPNSLAYAAAAYSMLVREVLAVVAATERGNFKASAAVQMMRDKMMDLSARRNFKPDFPVPAENDDNTVALFTDKFLKWARAAGVLDSSDDSAKPSSKERVMKKGKMKKRENPILPPTQNSPTRYSDTEEGEVANLDNLQFSHGVCKMVANHIQCYADPARYGDILESDLAVCYAPSDDQAEQVCLTVKARQFLKATDSVLKFIDDDDDTFNIPGKKAYFEVDPVNETCCHDVLVGR